MMLFDIIRDLNDQMAVAQDGMPARRQSILTGTTDGYNAVVHFMSVVIWESTTWDFSTYEHLGEERAIEAETRRIRNHIIRAIQAQTQALYNIQLDTPENLA